MAAVRWCLLITVTLSWLTIAPLDAGPVSINPAISPFGRNIRPIACKSKTGQVGTCMFAMDCTRMNGQHLGTCIDRFYFGSCCTASSTLDVLSSLSTTMGLLGNDIGSSSPSTLLGMMSTQQATPSSSEHPNALNNPTTTMVTPSSSPVTTLSSVPVGGSSVSTLAQLLSTSPATLSTLLTNPSTEAALTTLLASSSPAVGTETPVSSSVSSTAAPATTTTTVTSTTTHTPTITSSTAETTTSPTTTSETSTLPSTTSSSTTSITSQIPITTQQTTTPVVNVTDALSTTDATVSSTSATSTAVADTTSSTTTTAIPTTNTTPAITTITTSTTTIDLPSTISSTPAVSPSLAVTPPSAQLTTNGTTLGQNATLENTVDVTDPTLDWVEDTTQDEILDGDVTTLESLTDLPSVSLEPETTTQVPLSSATEEPIIELSTINFDLDDTTTEDPSTASLPQVVITSTPSSLSSAQSLVTNATTSAETTSASTSTTTSAEPAVNVSVTEATTTSTATTPATLSSSSIASESTTSPSVVSSEASTQLPAVTQTDLPIVDTTIQSILNESTIGSVISGTELNGTLDGVTIQHQNYHEVCGRPQYQYPSARIVGGTTTHYGQWPWQVSLRQWRTATFLHKCGAALLNENWAITAAHCVDNVLPDDLLLRMGEYDLATDEEEYPYVERKVQIVASHPQFDSRTFEYDLALLRFYDPVRFQPNIVPICLPPPGDIDYVGRTAFVTGWGRLYEDGPLPSKMQQVSVPVINNTECENMYRRAGYVEHIPKIFICAGYSEGKRDSCEGDSGGPMVIREEQSWVLAGVISWGIGCAEANQPGVYTRISEFREWIDKIIVF